MKRCCSDIVLEVRALDATSPGDPAAYTSHAKSSGPAVPRSTSRWQKTPQKSLCPGTCVPSSSLPVKERLCFSVWLPQVPWIQECTLFSWKSSPTSKTFESLVQPNNPWFLLCGPKHTWENWANVRSANMGTCPSSSWQQSLCEAMRKGRWNGKALCPSPEQGSFSASTPLPSLRTDITGQQVQGPLPQAAYSRLR